MCKCPSPEQNVPDVSMSPSPKSPGLLQLLTQPSTDTGHTQESPSERLSSPTEDMRLALNFSLILNDH